MLQREDFCSDFQSRPRYKQHFANITTQEDFSLGSKRGYIYSLLVSMLILAFHIKGFPEQLGQMCGNFWIQHLSHRILSQSCQNNLIQENLDSVLS